ncbi:hypothetical protein HWQ46_26125 [Shewanella sp. D64]|uniref:hypothetical protein n=1 Tax=unclassified Shewanella TaxID=196818 RepID=UPI0022BA2FA4|nr:MULTISPECIES: hypothetical protein [unclassified Shewanella]MEC4728994.1 hypothetical protein [Shewanella sp. D64]MEC4740020.1 hypothetical protein [Shewanella sp. E94]WBJ94376.1 hypothetical protein HWQ47_21285 [Shewanella sp. MTB7]
MRMSLSVVMGVIDKVTAPLKGMSAESNRYTKEIEKIQKAQADDSAALHLIDAHRRMSKEIDKNALSLNEATDKLTALQAKEKASVNAKKALNDEVAKQTERLARLKAGADAAGSANSQLNAKILEQSRALKKLKTEAAAANKPNHALTNQLAKQAERVAKLTQESDEYAQRLKLVSKGMKKADVDASKLDDEVTRLTASFDDHSKKIDGVSRRYSKLKSIMAPFQKMNKTIKMPSMAMVKGGAAMGVGALGSLAAFGAVITDTAAQVNELAKAAKDVNMPVEELQALRLQAQMAGAEAEDMDAAIKEMSLRWGEMKSLGSGAMNDYFKDTGNKKAYEDLKNAKDSMEAYQVIIREIAKEKDVAKQNFMADEFFGGDSEKMLSVLKSGTDGLNKAKQALRDSGGHIDKDSLAAADEFSTGLKKLLRIIHSLKVSGLTPVMKELSVVFGDLALKMKNMDWRNKAIVQLRETVSSVFSVFKALGGGILFLSENFKEIIATIALLKIGFIALNFAMLANPIGLIVAGVAAAVVAVTYLIDKFIGLGDVINAIRRFFGWGDEGDESLKKINEISGKMNELKDKSVEMGITTNEIMNTKKMFESLPGGSGELTRLAPVQPITPLMNHAVKSQAEVALTIKSDKPVSVDKANSDKGTNLNIDVGNMMLSY